MEAIHVQHLTFGYPGAAAPALRDVSLALEPGEFVTLCGPSGCGKTTLLRLLKPSLAPHGGRRGGILFRGAPLEALDRREECAALGFVGQCPERQLVTDRVWHELAFGLESLGCAPEEIRARVAELAAFFGIQSWFHQEVASLSGGQKQLLALASVLVARPSVLLLDEPTSQLDPISAGSFLEAVGRVNRELGTTVLLSEHRLEEVLPLSDRVAVLDRGRLLCCDAPARAAEALARCGLAAALPAPMRVWRAVETAAPCPVTVREGRRWLEETARERPLDAAAVPADRPPCGGDVVLEAREVWFRYGREDPDVLRGLSCTVRRGECVAILGGNGAGKSTLLSLLAGLGRPWRGRLRVLGAQPGALEAGAVGLLPQDPTALFVRSTARADLAEMLEDRGLSRQEVEARMTRVVRLCELEPLLDRHPYDLSGGEQQRLALAKLLLLEPQVLLLDEPTQGLDAGFKERLARLLRGLCAGGTTVVLVSHDVEFCARYADRCALCFDGALTATGPSRRFFRGNRFYTTAAHRMAEAALPEAVLAEDLIAALHGAEPQPHPPEDLPEGPAVPPPPPEPTKEGQPLPPRTRAGIALSLLAMPLTVLAGVFLLDDRKYYFISLLLLLETLVPFALAFEGRRPRAREVLLLAVLCALGAAGRAAFYMLPQVKPMAALVIVAGAAFGGETGFLTGAVTAFVSNLFFGQGPWTPWQMFAFGMAGLLAGLVFGAGRLRPTRRRLCVFGALTVFFLCGVLLDTGAALLWQSRPSLGVFFSYFLTGLPFNLIHATATAAFLWLFAEPLLEKLARVRRKYGLLTGKGELVDSA